VCGSKFVLLFELHFVLYFFGLSFCRPIILTDNTELHEKKNKLRRFKGAPEKGFIFYYGMRDTWNILVLSKKKRKLRLHIPILDIERSPGLTKYFCESSFLLPK